MIFKKFEPSEILRNTIKVFPNNDIFVDCSGNQYIKSLSQISPTDQNNSSIIIGNSLALSSGSYFLYSEQNSQTDLLPRNYNAYIDPNTSGSFVNYFFSSSLSAVAITSSNATSYNDTSSNSGISQRYKINSLRNTIEWYGSVSDAFKYSNFTNSEVALINIPSVYYGSTIKKGSIRLDFYITGNLIGTLQDTRLNGELVETTGSNTGSVAGIALYDEGVLLITGSWDLNTNVVDRYSYLSKSSGITIANDRPKWIHYGKSLLSASLLRSSSFETNFQGTDYIHNITLFAHADKNEFNTSNNKTFAQQGQSNYSLPFTSSNVYAEDKDVLIKNTVKTPYETVSGSFKKQTFINKIGIYDENKKLIAVAKLATPVKKNNEREYTFKLKLDI